MGSTRSQAGFSLVVSRNSLFTDIWNMITEHSKIVYSVSVLHITLRLLFYIFTVHVYLAGNLFTLNPFK